MQGLTHRIRRLAGISVAALLLAGFTATANAGHPYSNRVSNILDSNGFTTLKTALDLVGITPVLDQNRVTLFAPTNDVFDELATALGCANAVDMAVALNNLGVLEGILTNHAALGIYSSTRLLRAGTVNTVNGDVTTGVNKNGLYVQGAFNQTPSSITVEDIGGWRYAIYPIDQILLPVDPAGLPSPLCSS